ncbi:GNAT family N-acetyltransferase [Gilvimarinus xylanilyticus]|uniref:GNAT family N-acetyltransferase n=1 Tax=Gilvimarinus xylanilyticus TaxID=2944139 RepID=A0A9X2HSU6_9GAMM|nr:GNAT family N-acetyltransferase [Gilvimarinus xylanilyticus]MCP8897918.1 GNAT family N-acetyltransferase [Gilvimarinus xylanilyticus]
MEICDISAADTLTLRNEVLRPNQPLSACKFAGDDDTQTRHLGAINHGEVVGVVSLYRNAHPQVAGRDPYQIRGMATKPSFRGQGLGARLLQHAESYAMSAGGDIIWANARHQALQFYIRQGYKLASDEFVIDGIGPHFLIAKDLSFVRA